MKSIEEIEEMLVDEINNKIGLLNSNIELDNYNELMGDVSFLLSGVLELKLKECFSDWLPEKWLDDSLLSRVIHNGKKISIWGIMIWGKEDTTEEWTDPFYFEMILNENSCDFLEYTFLFSEEFDTEVTYEEFNQNRNMWDRNFYLNETWNPSDRDWKYIINTKKVLENSLSN